MTNVYRAPTPVLHALSRKWRGEMNYSTCLKLARMCFGPLAQVRPHNGGFRIYTQQGNTRTVHGEGVSYLEAFKDCYIVPEKTAEPESFPSHPNPESIPENTTDGNGA
jgi:hypothetical protein